MVEGFSENLVEKQEYSGWQYEEIYVDRVISARGDVSQLLILII
jgi:hypothetical protein